MSLPSISPDMLNAGTNRFLSRLVPSLGISLSEIDYLRGWKDDFLGDVIADQYTTSLSAGSTMTLLDGVQGGVIEMSTGAVLADYSRLWLGNAAGGYDSLDADEGWVEITYGRLMQLATCTWRFGAADSTIAVDVLLAGYDTNVSPNWALFTRSAAGAWNQPASAVAADTDKHWHVMDVYPITGAGRQVDHYLDGALINSTTTEMPTALLTPVNYILTRAGASKQFRCDGWWVIPRSLVA